MNEFPAGVVPGQTPGYPVAASTGEPLDLSDEQRAELAQHKLEQEDSEPEQTPEPVVSEALVTEGAVPGSAVENPGGLAPEVTRTSQDPTSGKILVDGAGNPMGMSPRQ